MTPKERYKKAGFKFDVFKNGKGLWSVAMVFKNGSLSTIWVVSSEAEAWKWVEDNFPLPKPSVDVMLSLKWSLEKAKYDNFIEAIKKKVQKEIKYLRKINKAMPDGKYEKGFEQAQLQAEAFLHFILADLSQVPSQAPKLSAKQKEKE